MVSAEGRGRDATALWKDTKFTSERHPRSIGRSAKVTTTIIIVVAKQE